MKTRIFALIVATMMILGLLVTGATVSFANETAEVVWGTSASDLTESGTLEEAFTAAQNDDSITYIKVMNDITTTNGTYIKGGHFTLDINGKTISCTNSTLFYLGQSVNITITDTSVGQNGVLESLREHYSVIRVSDESAIQVTIEAGTLRATHPISSAVASGAGSNMSLTLKGGTLVKTGIYTTGTYVDITWKSAGTLDLREYGDKLDGLFIFSEGYVGSVEESSVLLPDGFYFYKDGSRVDQLKDRTTYTIQFEDVTESEPEETTPEESEPEVSEPEESEPEVSEPEETTPEESEPEVSEPEETEPEVVEVIWGPDKDDLIYRGTIYEVANYAPEGETLYIQLVADLTTDSYLNLGFERYVSYTFDLNGYTLIFANGCIQIVNESEFYLVDSVGTGKIIAAQMEAIRVAGTLASIQGGELESEYTGAISWLGGELDLSAHPDPTGITITTSTEYPEKELLKLPAGYGIYGESGNRAEEVLYGDEMYTVGLLTYNIAVDYEADRWGLVSVYVTPEEGSVAPGQTVTFTAEVADLFGLDFLVNGGSVELTYDEENGVYSFVMPDEDVEISVVLKYNAFLWGPDKDTLTGSGDIYDLVAAINEGKAPYAKFIGSNTVYFNRGELPDITGKSLIDLSEGILEFEWIENGYPIVLNDGADITLYANITPDTVLGSTGIPVMAIGIGAINSESAIFAGDIYMTSGSKFTVSGVKLNRSSMYYAGGDIDISDANWGSELWFYYGNEESANSADVIDLGERFRIKDEESVSKYMNENITTLGTITNVKTLKPDESYYVFGVFTLSFDFGEGSGEMPKAEVASRYFQYGLIPTPQNVTHPNGLSIVGWSWEAMRKEYVSSGVYYHMIPVDVTLTAVWGASVYVGGVGMFDGDYLPNGATETTKQKPLVGGYAYYKDGVLTLNNFTYAGAGFVTDSTAGSYYDQNEALIYSMGDLVIELVGKNDFKPSLNAGTVYAIMTRNLTINGTGSLQMTTDESGVAIMGNLTVNGGDILLMDEIGAYDETLGVTGDLVVNGGSLTIMSDAGILVCGDMTITAGEVRVQKFYGYYGNDAIFAYGNINILGGKLVVDFEKGIYAMGNITVSGGQIDIEVYADAICAEQNITITGGKIYIYSENGSGIVTYDGAMMEKSAGLLTAADDDISVANKNIIITGGNIEIYAYHCGISNSFGNITITGGEVFASAYVYGIYAEYGNITVSNATLEIFADQYALFVQQYIGEDDEPTPLSVTITDSKVTIFSGIGIISNVVTITNSEIEIEVSICGIQATKGLTVTDSTVIITSEDGSFGIITDKQDGSSELTDVIIISGSKLEIRANVGIYARGGMSITDSEIDIFASGYGITAGTGSDADVRITIKDSKVNISGAAVAIYVYGDVILQNVEATLTSPIMASDRFIDDELVPGNITVIGGSLIIVGESAIVTYEGDVSLEDAYVLLVSPNAAIICNVLNISGTKTVFVTSGKVRATTVNVTEADLGFQYTSEPESEMNLTVFEGKDVTHTWSTDYTSDETHHWHECTDEECYLQIFEKQLYTIHPASGFGEHVIPENEEDCTVCTTEDEIGDEVIQDAVAMVGKDGYLLSGQYLTNDGKVVNEKPAEGGYLYVLVEGEEGTVVLNNFVADLDVIGLLLDPTAALEWNLLLEGTNALNIIPAAKIDEGINADINGVGIWVMNANLTVMGKGNLTIQATNGVVVGDGAFCVEGDATVTINAEDTGIFADNSSVVIYGANLIVNAIEEDGIYVTDGSIYFSEDSNVTITAGDDGIRMNNGDFYVGAGTTITITAGDDGIAVSADEYIEGSYWIDIFNANIKIDCAEDGLDWNCMNSNIVGTTLTVNADDDALEINNTYVEWYGNTLNLTAGEDGLDFYFDVANYYEQAVALDISQSVINIHSKQDGIWIYAYEYAYIIDCIVNVTADRDGINILDYSNVYIIDSTVNITAADDGIYLADSSLEIEANEGVCEVNINSKWNYLYYSNLILRGTEMNVAATETGFGLYDSYLYITGAEIYDYDTENYHYRDSVVNITGANEGIYSEYEGYLDVDCGQLHIDTKFAGILGDIQFTIEYGYNVSVRAPRAIDVARFRDLYAGYYNSEMKYENYDGDLYEYVTFVDENGYMADHVVLQTWTAMQNDIYNSIEELNKLLSEDGNIAEIVNSISEINGMIDTLTNANGEGRLDLIEAANAAIQAALAALDEDLSAAQKELSDAIENGDEALDQKISNLNSALEDVKSAYDAADKAMSDALTAKITAAETTVAALQAKITSAESTINALQAAVQALQEANQANADLKAELDALKNSVAEERAEAGEEKPTALQTATTVMAIVGVVCNAGFISTGVYFVLKKKKLIFTK